MRTVNGIEAPAPGTWFLGTSLAMLGLFAVVEDGLRFTVTGPLFSF